ncbi:hypothetical protein [Dehalogenimonas etheniformans]|uniref:Uncharacterized protein n=1 Tax=Dehalogenimonas etheniformans TaxID=1536648 RepID=A0A2P5P5J9_9CHLR|nr:hypothetical protein [Dehalogenimonas etheniformans]PPD57569.1 hypothetical protein JP09_007415 [Dehalogenimonas etheniformans]QNT75907.1 hypothetical protein HX448_03995 [Dehalogenimonas etheniformans]
MTMLLARQKGDVSGNITKAVKFTDLSFGDIEACARDMTYPINNLELVHQAKLDGASSDTVKFLNLLPEGKCNHSSQIVFMAWEYFLV